VLAGAVATVLLIACANIAGCCWLARARGAARSARGSRSAPAARACAAAADREPTVSAIGALSALLLVHLIGDSVGRLFLESEHPPGSRSRWAGACSCSRSRCSAAIGVAFGMAPALVAARGELVPALRAGFAAERSPARAGGR
jgi:hypothetical protein